MKIVILEPIALSQEKLQLFTDPFKNQGHTIEYYDNRPLDNQTIIDRAHDADIVVLTNLPFSKEVILQCTNLKMISVAFTGVDHIDLTACKEKNITVCNAAGYSTFSVAELTFGLVFSLMRHIILCDHNTRLGRTRSGLIGNELHGKIFGVIGTGAIGSQVIQAALAFGCQVIAYSRSEKTELKNLGVKYLPLHDLLRESDIISLHLPLNTETKGLIDLTSLQMMKPSALLINCARGPIIKTQDLITALKNRVIAGAGLDVFDHEPPLNEADPLFQVSNLIMTPHVAFATHEAFAKRATIVFENIRNWLNKTPINVV